MSATCVGCRPVYDNRCNDLRRHFRHERGANGSEGGEEKGASKKADERAGGGMKKRGCHLRPRGQSGGGIPVWREDRPKP